jgi:hypothetical protein
MVRTCVFSRQRFRYFEEHDIGRDDFAATRVGSGCVVDEGEILSLVLGEVDDQIEAFAGGDDQVVKA